MAHLESPSIDVKRIAHDAFRVTIESETSIHKFDLSDCALVELAQEAVDAITSEIETAGTCSICHDEDEDDDPRKCEIVALRDSLADHVRNMQPEHRR